MKLKKILDYILSIEERIRNAANPRTIFEMRGIMLLNTDNLISPLDIVSSSNISISEDNNINFDNINEERNLNNLIIELKIKLLLLRCKFKTGETLEETIVSEEKG